MSAFLIFDSIAKSPPPPRFLLRSTTSFPLFFSPPHWRPRPVYDIALPQFVLLWCLRKAHTSSLSYDCPNSKVFSGSSRGGSVPPFFCALLRHTSKVDSMATADEIPARLRNGHRLFSLILFPLIGCGNRSLCTPDAFSGIAVVVFGRSFWVGFLNQAPLQTFSFFLALFLPHQIACCLPWRAALFFCQSLHRSRRGLVRVFFQIVRRGRYPLIGLDLLLFLLGFFLQLRRWYSSINIGL